VGTEIYVLDEQMHQVADGQSGEIYVGGAGLARGYRNRPDLTAEKFISNPFSSVPGSRLYKTGDLGRFLPGGDIAFLGRTDEQIKLRGYRIEPGEIVSVLDRHPMVQASTVLVHEDKAGNRRLIGYVVPTPGTQPTPKILSDFLAGVLPDYMIPGVFLRLDSLPLSHSGKVDRRTLPEPNQANMLREENYVAPQTGVQNRIRAILATLLKVEKLGLNDNFFMLGGDSLLGAQLIARLRDAFHVEPSLLSLFDNPTIAELSAEVERLLLAKVRALTEEEATGLMQSGPQ
jgi:acyl carrier protein